MRASTWSKRLAVASAAFLVALGFHAAAAPSQRLALDAELRLVTAGPGKLTVTPAETGAGASCAIDAQTVLQGSQCTQRYEKGTKVTLKATPTGSARFVGWGDFACPVKLTTCKLTLGAGVRYVTASFGPVKLEIQGGDYGRITVTPGGTCDATATSPPCTFHYPWGTTVTLRREHAAEGAVWMGSCLGSVDGKLDAATCKVTLQGNELVGAGLEEPGIPPPLGTGIFVKLGGKGKGKVTGKVVGGTDTLDCGNRCKIAGLVRTDSVRLKAVPKPGSKFYRWSDADGKGGFNKLRIRVVPMASVNRLRASFVKK